jgi:hypothetical protein
MNKLEDVYRREVARRNRLDKMVRIARGEGSTAAEADDFVRGSVVTGIYEHFKSTTQKVMRYAVLGVCRYVDNGPYYVEYAALYGPHLGKRALRSLLSKKDGFLMPVDSPELNYRGPRFILIERVPLESLVGSLRIY